jgi:hypothetical protein
VCDALEFRRYAVPFRRDMLPTFSW